jgi:hypothetical protein
MYIMVQRAYNGAEVNGTILPPSLYAVQGLVNNKNTITYFDGSSDYRNNAASTSPYRGDPTPNIKTNKPAAQALDDKLARYLGAGFGCSGGGSFATSYPYAMQSMSAVHSGMGITQVQFTAFIRSEEGEGSTEWSASASMQTLYSLIFLLLPSHFF